MAQNQDKETVLKGCESATRASSRPSRTSGCCGTWSSCCGPGAPGAVADPRAESSLIGYSAEELAAAPEGANLGLGCGNPQAIAALKQGRRSSIWARAPALTAFWRHGRWARQAG